MADMTKKPTKSRSLQYLDQMQGLSGYKSPEATEAPEMPTPTLQSEQEKAEAQVSLKDALAKAKSEYSDEKTKNQWLDVAQTLGRAITQFGAAQAGMRSNRDMSGLNFGSGTNFEDRTNRAFQEYQQTGKELEKDQERRDLGDALKRKQGQETYEKQRDYLGTALKQAEADEDRSLRERLAREQAAREDAKDRNRDKKEVDREDKQLRGLQVKDLQTQLKDTQKEMENVKSAANILSSMDDLSKKSMQKIETQMPGILGRAGITPEQLSEIEQEATEKGMIWDSVNKETRNKLIQQKIVQKKQEDINNLRQAIDSLLQKKDNNSSKSSRGSEEVPAKSQQKNDPQVQQYADQYLKGDYAKAKQVLINRGYSPKEAQ